MRGAVLTRALVAVTAVFGSGCFTLKPGTDLPDRPGGDAAVDRGAVVDQATTDTTPDDVGNDTGGPTDLGHDAGGDTGIDAGVDAGGVLDVPRDLGSDRGATVDARDAMADLGTPTDGGGSCPPGSYRVAGGCAEIPAPRPIAPLSGSVVSVLQPTFRWALPPGITEAIVDICPTRTCSTVTTSFRAGAGATSGRVSAMTFAARSKYYWRLRGAVGASEGLASNASPVWMLTTGSRATDNETAGGNSLRDMNGDGFAELVMGQPSRDGVQIHPSTAAGPLFGNAYLIVSARTTDSDFGELLGLGDFTGDGYADALTVSRESSTLWVWLARGVATGASVLADDSQRPPGTNGARSIAVGDIDIDGYADVALGFPADGRVLLLRGSARGLGQVASDLQTLSTSFTEEFGTSLGITDVTGDGFPDLVVGSTSNTGGSVAVYRGATGTLSTTPLQRVVDASAGSSFGAAVAGLGDFNGDGYGDFAVGAPASERVTAAPYVRVYAGGPSAPLATLREDAGSARSLFGSSIAGVGDMNGDGRAELVIGAPNDTANPVATVVLGAPTSPEVTLWRYAAPSGVSSFGLRVDAVGDISGDGLADVAVVSDARVYVFTGRRGGSQALTSTWDFTWGRGGVAELRGRGAFGRGFAMGATRAGRGAF